MGEPPHQYIDLSWPDYPVNYYVKGHVTPEEFANAVRHHEGEVEYETPVHVYALWAQTGNSRENDWTAELMEFDTPGRGRFKVTRAESIEHRRWKREAEKMRDAQLAKYAGGA